MVDTQGFLLAVNVHTVGISDREGAKVLLGDLGSRFPRISHLFADHGYIGTLREWIKEHLHWETEIVLKETNTSRQNWAFINDQPVLVPKPKGGFQVQRRR